MRAHTKKAKESEEAETPKSEGKHGRPDARIALSPHAALKTRAEGEVLVLPERAMRLGGSGGEILRHCFEPRTIDEIISELAKRHPGVPDLENSVSLFLTEMLELGGLIRCPEIAS